MRIISQRLDVWNPETGVATQDRSTRMSQDPAQQTPAPAAKPSVTQLPDGTWKLIKDAPGKVGAKVTQIWDKTKKNMIKQWESSAAPVMASRDYRSIIKSRASMKKTADGEWAFETLKVPLTVFPSDGSSIRSAKVDLKWRVVLDVRDWGVKEFSPSVDDQVIAYSAEVEDPSGEGYIDQEFTLPIQGEHVKISYSEGKSSALYPNEITVHQNEIDIQFSQV